MPHHEQQSAALSIERHAAQYILHAALSEGGGTGIVGWRQAGVISHAMILHEMKSNAFATICSNWQAEGIFPCGTFSTSEKRDTTSPEEVETFNTLLRQACRESAGNDPLHLLVSLNTKGCLETQAFRLQDHQIISIPLVLLEDGQTSRKS